MLCMPNVDDLRNWILEEDHGSHYFIHPGSAKMYHDNREVFWWEGLKKNISKFVTKCPNSRRVKAEHQITGDLLQEIQVPTWKWEDINMDFLVGLPRTQKKHESIWVIVDSLTKSVHIIPSSSHSR